MQIISVDHVVCWFERWKKKKTLKGVNSWLAKEQVPQLSYEFLVY